MHDCPKCSFFLIQALNEVDNAKDKESGGATKCNCYVQVRYDWEDDRNK